jgi:hypothetical protein
VSVALLCLWLPSGAVAQTEPSAADRDAAATAYDRGTSSFLSHDYARAAQWFETAYRLAPNPQALVGAIRAHERNGDLMRAGTLALRAEAHHASDAAAARTATATLAQATPLFLRVDVTCSGPEGPADCTIELDGVVQSHTSFFVAPSAEHRVVAAFETGNAETTVSGAAGQTQAITLEAPPPPAVVADGGDTAPVTDPGGSSGGGGITPAVFVVGAVLTAGAGATLVWSGVDTLEGVGPYQMDPTPERLADGQSRELRTNILIGVTAGLAVGTLVLAFVTDWDGDPAPAEASPAEGEPAPGDSARSAAAPSPVLTAVSIAPMPSPSGDGLVGAAVGVGGRF